MRTGFEICFFFPRPHWQAYIYTARADGTPLYPVLTQRASMSIPNVLPKIREVAIYPHLLLVIVPRSFARKGMGRRLKAAHMCYTAVAAIYLLSAFFHANCLINVGRNALTTPSYSIVRTILMVSKHELAHMSLGLGNFLVFHYIGMISTNIRLQSFTG